MSRSREMRLYLLGDFRLERDRQPVHLPTHKIESLLAYLVLHRDAPQSRRYLAFQLWPDSSEGQARTNLRQLLHGLRQALLEASQFVIADAQTLQWREDATFHLDVAEFEEALTQAAAAEQHGDLHALRMALERASAIYHGDLLPSCYDDWILPERERLRQDFTETLERLMLLLEGQGEPRAAMTYAQRLLRHDPLREETYRGLMRLYSACGDRAGALRVYYTCATVLERELAVEPSAATREAYEQLVKRMYVCPSSRKQGLGRALIDRLLDEACEIGYERVRLDSARFMREAHHLYRSVGFREIEAYEGSEIPAEFQKHWIFMEIDLPPRMAGTG